MTPLVFAALPLLVERSPALCSNTRKKNSTTCRVLTHRPSTGAGQFCPTTCLGEVVPNDVGSYLLWPPAPSPAQWEGFGRSVNGPQILHGFPKE